MVCFSASNFEAKCHQSQYSGSSECFYENLTNNIKLIYEIVMFLVRDKIFFIKMFYYKLKKNYAVFLLFLNIYNKWRWCNSFALSIYWTINYCEKFFYTTM